MRVTTLFLAMYFHLNILNHLNIYKFSHWEFNTDSEKTRFDCIFLIKLLVMLTHRLWPNRNLRTRFLTRQEMVLRIDPIHVHTFHELFVKVGQAPVAWMVGVATPHSSHNPSFSLHSYKCYWLSVWVSYTYDLHPVVSQMKHGTDHFLSNFISTNVIYAPFEFTKHKTYIQLKVFI